MPYRESIDESQVDHFDLPHWAQQLKDAWTALPPDLKSMIISYVKQNYPIAYTQVARLLAMALPNIQRGLPIPTAVDRAAYRLGIQRRAGAVQPGLSTTQVQQYRRRQMQRLPSDRRKFNSRWRR